MGPSIFFAFICQVKWDFSNYAIANDTISILSEADTINEVTSISEDNLKTVENKFIKNNNLFTQ